MIKARITKYLLRAKLCAGLKAEVATLWMYYGSVKGEASSVGATGRSHKTMEMTRGLGDAESKGSRTSEE